VYTTAGTGKQQVVGGQKRWGNYGVELGSIDGVLEKNNRGKNEKVHSWSGPGKDVKKQKRSTKQWGFLISEAVELDERSKEGKKG